MSTAAGTVDKLKKVPDVGGFSDGFLKYIYSAVRNTIEYLLLLLIILECNSLYLHYAGSEELNEKIFRYGIIALASVLVVLRIPDIRKHIKSVLKLFPYLIGLYFIMDVFLIFNVRKMTSLSEDYITSFMIFLPILCLLFYLDRLDGEPYRLFRKYSNLIVVYAALTLLVYLWVTLCPYKMPASEVYTHWSNKGNILTYQNYFGITTIKDEKLFSLGSIVFYKNIGAFTEPPMAMIPLVTALFIELFLRGGRETLFRSLLLAVVIFTTGSTLGLMLVIFAVLLKVILLVPDKYRIIVVALCTAAGAAGIAALFILKKRNDSGSLSVHLQDYVLAIKAFLNNPIFGGGYYNDGCVTELMSESRFNSNSGLSNSIAVIAAQGGIILEFICACPFVLGMLRFFSRNKTLRSESLFFVGTFALYVVTIFHYRFFLLFLMAFGYSLMPFRLNNMPESEFSAEPIKHRGLSLVVWFIPAVISLLTLGNAWKWLFAFMKSNSLLLSQSAFNPIIAAGLLILFIELIAGIFRGSDRINSLIYSAIAAVSALAVLPFTAKISSLGQTLCELIGKGSYSEFVILVLEALPAVCLCMLVYAVLKVKNKRIFIAVAAAAVVLPVAVFFGSGKIITMKSADEDVLKDETILNIASSAGGKVYSDVLPELYSSGYSFLSLSSRRGDEYSQLDNISVLMSGNHEEMFEEGFMCVKSGGDRALYTNDSAVIEALRNEGFTLYNHYPNKSVVDLAFLASMNGLSCNESGNIVMNGESESIIHGPYLNLDDGIYSVTFSLRAGKEITKGAVCTLRISSEGGQNVIKTKTLNADDFEDGKCVVTLRFTAEDARNVELLIFDYQKVTLKGIAYKINPNYDTVNIRGEYNRVVRTEFMKAGEPYTVKGGYAALEKSYDSDLNVSDIKYFDESGEPCLVKKCYAEIKREYNGSGKITRESYYGTDGKPVLCRAGYSYYTAVYGDNGKVSERSYYDIDGELTLNSSGFATVKYEYGKQKKLVRVSYYDVSGNLTEISKGYCEIKYTYNETWRKRLSKTAYDLSGNKVGL